MTFERRDAGFFEGSVGLARPIYLVAVASDVPFVGSIGSLYIETSEIETIFTTSRTAKQQAEECRQQLVKSKQDSAALQEAFDTLEAQYRGEQHWLAQFQAAYCALQQVNESLRQTYNALRASHTAVLDERQDLKRKHQQAIATLVAEESSFQTALGEKNAQITYFQKRVAESEHHLNAVLNSTSWRLTGPLRGIAIRNPGLVRFLRDFLSRHPRMRRLALRSVRSAWRVLTLRSITLEAVPTVAAASTPSPSEAAPAVAAASTPSPPALPPPSAFPIADPAVDPMLWFYIGDTIDWLQAHEQLTGVGKVTMELFFASLNSKCEHPAVPCVLGNGTIDLVSAPRMETVSYLASKLGRTTLPELAFLTNESVASRFPTSGDHVLFTGVVWTPVYSEVFRSLSQKAIRFSVLVYDIIPIEHPDIVGQRHHEIFREWLETTVTLASVVFVSSIIIKDQILKWAAISGISLKAAIVPIEFGYRKMENARSYDELKADEATSCVRLDSFVLSVGTIDKRKNQALLCRLWKRLIADLGDAKVPQLALVGRDDVKFAELDEEISALVIASKIVVLEGLGDAEVAGLYDACLFTAFPSLSEAHGVPVAQSLQYGKLCISSDLPVIRERADDLPWYFDAADEAAAYALLRRAIEDPDARAAAERRIAERYRPCTWASTYHTISEAAYELSKSPVAPSQAPTKSHRQAMPGIPVAVMSSTLAKFQKWCTDLDPEVSIVVINWNTGQLTRECITHIWANTDDVRYEILIVDNGSDPDDSAPLRALGRGVRLFQIGTNRFFGEANNIAAESACGRYVCFLNNDAFVQPGWLRSLVDDLECTPEAGAVGPLFLFSDYTIQEAGTIIDEGGYPERLGRGHSPQDLEFFVPKFVDYVSAATLLLTRELFMAVGGFDLAYEAAYYEDADLCFKIRAFGRKVRYCPNACVIRIEGSVGNTDPVAEARNKAMDDLNRGKFTSRWGAYLKSRSDADLEIARNNLQCYEPKGTESYQCAEAGTRTAAMYTPFYLTPGGGERYLLTLASALTMDHVVTIVTPHRYSYLRLRNLGHEFGVDLSKCKLITEEEFALTPPPDLMVTLGNYVVPPIEGRGRTSFYVCQFPFPLSQETVRDRKRLFAGYRSLIAYSEYAKSHILAGLSAYQFLGKPVEVINPPVPLINGDARRKRAVILSVGRFFEGGHNKRHDLMIAAFRAFVARSDMEAELHLAGSSVPSPEQLDYLDHLRQLAKGSPIVFHVNVTWEKLFELYRDAAIYWHNSSNDSYKNPSTP
jgi:GT2 family glycosyltransferase/glycosyltransferase involved in cell wall biosynthesis